MLDKIEGTRLYSITEKAMWQSPLCCPMFIASDRAE